MRTDLLKSLPGSKRVATLHSRRVKLKIHLGRGVTSLAFPKWVFFSLEVKRQNRGGTVAAV